MVPSVTRGLVVAVLLACAVLCTEAARAAEIPEGLQNYVARPEAVYRWELREKITRGTSTIYDLHLVSQDWQGIVWEHQLQVYQSADAKPAATILLWNQGGQASDGSIAFGLELAKKIGTPVAFLYDVPKQPLFEGKTEDAWRIPFFQEKPARCPARGLPIGRAHFRIS